MTIINTMKSLQKDKKINPPNFVIGSCQYLTIAGSLSYGCSSDYSDFDLVGFCIPPKEIIFSESQGLIHGFDLINDFSSWSQHHIKDPVIDREYDFTIYNIVKYFKLIMDGNPNMIDSLFTYDSDVLLSTNISSYLRENRKLFLSKKCKAKYAGYAFSQLKKIDSKSNTSNPARKATIEKYGYDIKFAYHLIRLLLQAEQILETEDLDLRKDSMLYKDIRAGNWSKEELIKMARDKERDLEELYAKSTLRWAPDEKSIKTILINCIEMYYGSLVEMSKQSSNGLILELKNLISKYEED